MFFVTRFTSVWRPNFVWGMSPINAKCFSSMHSSFNCRNVNFQKAWGSTPLWLLTNWTQSLFQLSRPSPSDFPSALLRW